MIATGKVSKAVPIYQVNSYTLLGLFMNFLGKVSSPIYH